MSALSGLGFERAAVSRAAASLVDAPPALREAATRIRARLGDWAAAVPGWNIWSAANLKVWAISGPGNLAVYVDSTVPLAEQASWLASGAALLIVEGRFATLIVNGMVYRLSGDPHPEWLAAFAAFLDCACLPQDALCWAWGWRPTQDTVHDWPTDPERMPCVVGLPARVEGEIYPACPPALGLYPVVPDAEWVERLLELGVTTIQLRIKSAEHADGQRQIEHEVHRAVAAGRAYQARVFINDHWQLALQAGAYGVHLGQEDLLVADLGAIARAGMRLGLSTHGVYEMLLAWHYRPSYLAFGAVFPTQTKQLNSDPQGIARLARFVDLFAARVSTVAIGGIDLAVLPQVLATGVGSAAVVRAVTAAADVGGAVAALEQVFAERRL